MTIQKYMLTVNLSCRYKWQISPRTQLVDDCDSEQTVVPACHTFNANTTIKYKQTSDNINFGPTCQEELSYTAKIYKLLLVPILIYKKIGVLTTNLQINCHFHINAFLILDKPIGKKVNHIRIKCK